MSFNHLTIRNYSQGDFKPILKLWKSTRLANTERADSEEVIEKTIRAGGLFLVLTLRTNSIGLLPYVVACGLSGLTKPHPLTPPPAVGENSAHQLFTWFGALPSHSGEGAGDE
ncbi:MAG: hypothetical protein KAG99_06435, partial [Bacteroidales bacterium]|nr:hypothetical protein [Bacteroidales bacterium]